jgi:putative PIN family toxin of toxin-antitoxin system
MADVQEQRHRIVLDTNTVLSSLISPGGAAANAVAAAFGAHEVVESPETLRELGEKLASPRLAAFIDPDFAKIAFKAFAASVTMVEAAKNVTVCRDPKDNMFLDLAVAARALAVVSGDRDLRTLKHINGIGHVIPIIDPQQYLGRMQDAEPEPARPDSPFAALQASRRRPPKPG